MESLIISKEFREAFVKYNGGLPWQFAIVKPYAVIRSLYRISYNQVKNNDDVT